MALGDAVNDVEMLQLVGRGVAMGRSDAHRKIPVGDGHQGGFPKSGCEASHHMQQELPWRDMPSKSWLERKQGGYVVSWFINYI